MMWMVAAMFIPALVGWAIYLLVTGVHLDTLALLLVLSVGPWSCPGVFKVFSL